MLREFGWKLDRLKIYDSSEDNGEFPDGYMWTELNDPVFYPLSLQGRIKDMGLTQTGSGDNGKADNMFYDISHENMRNSII